MALKFQFDSHSFLLLFHETVHTPRWRRFFWRWKEFKRPWIRLYHGDGSMSGEWQRFQQVSKQLFLLSCICLKSVGFQSSSKHFSQKILELVWERTPTTSSLRHLADTRFSEVDDDPSTFFVKKVPLSVDLIFRWKRRITLINNSTCLERSVISGSLHFSEG